MKAKRSAEIVGGGFAGLAAACALAQRGWRVRLHERADRLRTAGAGINVYENGLRVLEALGACEDTIRDGARHEVRETRDQHDRLLSRHPWHVRVYGVLRQRMVDALAAAAQRAGAQIITGSEGLAATADGTLRLAKTGMTADIYAEGLQMPLSSIASSGWNDHSERSGRSGEEARADLIIAADGVNSRIRDGLGLVGHRRYLPDGAIRLLIPKLNAEEATDGRTIEYFSGNRRFLYNPCSSTHLYLAMTMLHTDTAARAVPVDKALWKQAFPHLAPLIERIGEVARYDRFEYIRLKRWSAGKVAVIGDAAHAIPPNIGQGAGCAMMNALALAVYLDRHHEVSAALDAWERAERPLTNHTQRISLLFGMPAFWPPKLRALFYSIAARSRWLTEQRTRTARHIPTGT